MVILVVLYEPETSNCFSVIVKQEDQINYMEKKMETLFEEVFDAIAEVLKSQGIPFKREDEAKRRRRNLTYYSLR